MYMYMLVITGNTGVVYVQPCATKAQVQKHKSVARTRDAKSVYLYTLADTTK